MNILSVIIHKICITNMSVCYLCIYYFIFYLSVQLLRPEEVEMLVCGSPELDMSALQKAAQYEGYNKTDSTVR